MNDYWFKLYNLYYQRNVVYYKSKRRFIKPKRLVHNRFNYTAPAALNLKSFFHVVKPEPASCRGL